MSYVEFLVFLCRITHEHYETTEHKNEEFFKKVDHMLPMFLDYVGLKCDFQFHELFATEIKEYQRAYMRRKRQFEKEKKKAGGKPDPKIVFEFKAYEKSIK